MWTCAIILAAGESRRMGRPKALLPFRGGTFLSEITRALARRCSPVIAVFGFNADQMICQAPETVVPVVNRDFAQGMITSLQAGLRAVPESCDAALFTLVDHPAVDSGTIDALLDGASRKLIAIPRFENRRGHPVLIRRAIFGEFLREPVTSEVRRVIDRHADEVAYIDVSDPGISDDVDDPQMLEKLLAREAARL